MSYLRSQNISFGASSFASSFFEKLEKRDDKKCMIILKK